MFFADESGVRSGAFMPGRPGGYAGKPLLSATLANAFASQYAVCDSRPKANWRFMTSRKRLSAALFIEFLRRLITNYPKKIFLVVDGLPAHKAKSRCIASCTR